MSIGGTEPDEGGPQSGFALIVVIMFLLTVATLMTPFVFATRGELLRSSESYRKDRLDLLAKGLAHVLAHDLALPETEASGSEVPVNSEPVRCVAAGLEVVVRAQDQRGLVGLNTADEAQLQVAFVAMGFDNAQAQSMARSVVEYRDEEKEGSANTGQDEVWDGYKRGPFAAVEELYDLKLLAGEPLRSITESFTIHNVDGLLLAPAMPAHLARLLPTEPTGLYPFVRSDDFATPRYRIEITITVETSGISGYHGMIVDAQPNGEGAFVRLADAVSPDVLPGSPLKAGGTPAVVTEMTCEVLFGPAVAAVLRGFEG